MRRSGLFACLFWGCTVMSAWGQAPEPAPAAKDPATPPAAAADQDGKKTDDAQPAAASVEELQAWIKDLVNPKFAVRQAASQKLVQAGVPGMQAAAEAAKSEDLEVATRCLAVLTEGLSSKSEKVRETARAALKSLADSENKSVAQRARQALDTPRGAGAGAFPNGMIAGGMIPNGMRRMQVTITNGVRQTTVVEGDREVVIKDTNNKDITLTVTETVNGKKQTTTYAAKDVDELKKNSPEAATMYEKYRNGNAAFGMRVQINGNIGVPNVLVPGQFPAQAINRRPRIINPIKAGELLEELDKLRGKLEESTNRLSKAAQAEKPDTEELKKIAEEIKGATTRLGEIKTELQLP